MKYTFTVYFTFVCLMYAHADSSSDSFLPIDPIYLERDYHASHSLKAEPHPFFKKTYKKVKKFFKKKDSHINEIGDVNIPNGGIGFINGINNSEAEAEAHAQRLSAYGGGVKISQVYNATHSKALDLAECMLAKCGIDSPPTKLLQEQWEDFFDTHPPDIKFLQICHSQGAHYVKDALENLPSEKRQRIIVLAIAPAVIIPNKLCHSSKNYASLGDFVTQLDIKGRSYSEELIKLEPHPDAEDWDHNFASPTYQDILQDEIKHYLESCAS